MNEVLFENKNLESKACDEKYISYNFNKLKYLRYICYSLEFFLL
jgi:hypothetical protein